MIWILDIPGTRNAAMTSFFQASNYDRLQRPVEKNQAHEPIFFFADLDSVYSKVLLCQIW